MKYINIIALKRKLKNQNLNKKLPVLRISFSDSDMNLHQLLQRISDRKFFFVARSAELELARVLLISKLSNVAHQMINDLYLATLRHVVLTNDCNCTELNKNYNHM